MSNRPRILVVGATGMLGMPVARRLKADGFDVRILSRNPERAAAAFGEGYEFFAGDVRAPATLDQAMEGCVGVHINLRARTLEQFDTVEVSGTRALAEAAGRHGVSRLTYLSGAGIENADPALLPVRTKRAAEAAIRDAGVPYTVFRATHFMESLDLFIRGGRATIIGRQPNPYHYLAAEDYARMVARAHKDPGAANRVLAVLGPEPFTMEEALKIFVRNLRPDVRLGRMPLWLFRALSAITRDPDMAVAAMLFDAFPRIPETGDGTQADQLLGAPSITLVEWCRRMKMRSPDAKETASS